jgi:hypothetical protein
MSAKLVGLPVAVDDAPAVEVVRRELDLDAVAEEDLDAMTTHPPGGVPQRLVSVVELNPEHPVAKGLDHFALELDFLFLDRDNGSFRSNRRR